MFEYSLLHWTTFVSASALLSLSPGPDLAFILGSTVRNGQRSGFAAMFGVWAGAIVHVLLAASGLSVILATSATAFTLVKWAGAIYLIWLGLQALLKSTDPFSTDSTVTETDNYKIFKQGVIVATFNPKDALFFLAFLPQFVVPGAGPVSAQLLLHGCLVLVVAAFIEPPMVLLGAKIGKVLNKDTRLSRFFDKCLGVMFIGLGLRLALMEHD